MDRLNKFEKLKLHAWYKTQFAKLKPKNIEFCVDFIMSNNELNKIDFEKAVNRIFVDLGISSESKAEQNRLRICQELLACANNT
jgi:hypothetical protein